MARFDLYRARLVVGHYMKRYGALFLIAIYPRAVYAADFDRPNFTDHSFTVPPRVFQIESGFQHAHDRRPEGKAESFSFPTLMRYGVTEHAEARVEGDVANISRGSSVFESDEESLTTATLGLKDNIYRNYRSRWQPSVAIIGRVAPPGGEGTSMAEHVTGDIRLLLDANLSDVWKANANIGVAFAEQKDHDTFTTAMGTFALQRSITESISLSGEVAYQSLESARGADHGLYLDLAAAYSVTSDLQLDIYGGSGLRGSDSADAFWSAGISYRFS